MIFGLGETELAAVMPEVIRTAESADSSPETRDGYILLYIYLPMVFKEKFVGYLPQIIPSILMVFFFLVPLLTPPCRRWQTSTNSVGNRHCVPGNG